MSIVIYSDLDYNLKIDGSGNVTIITNENSIQQSIRTILTTRPGERIMLPSFGSYLRDYLFEPMNDITADAMRSEITRNINAWEDRVYLLGVYVTPDYDNNSYEISIAYKIILSGRQEQFNALVSAKV